MTYEVHKRSAAEITFLHMQQQAELSGIPEALAAMFGQVFQYATTHGLALAGQPVARYPCFGPGLITIEAGMPITGSADGDDEVKVGSLPGGPLATTVHKGPYDALNQAHEAIQAWITENGEQPGGAPWEVYLTDPGEVPDPADWLTEVNWPLQGD